VGAWRIEHRIDNITGAPAPTGILLTRASNSRELYQRPALMQLMCFGKQPVVRFEFEFRVGANRNTTVGYRFDNTPGHDVDATFMQDHRTVVIEDKAEVAQFYEELASANVLLLRISSLFAGRTTAEFPVAGASAAIEPILAACPLPSARKTARRSS
jgi:hypothetical protein